MGRTFLLLVVVATASCFVPAPVGWRASRTCGLRVLAQMPGESTEKATETDVSQAAVDVSDLLDGEVQQGKAIEDVLEMEGVLEQTLTSMADKAEEEAKLEAARVEEAAKREAAKAEAVKVASAVGELGMAVGMATGKTVLTVGAEAGKALFKSVVPELPKMFAPKPAAKVEEAPYEMPMPEVVEPVAPEPVEAVEEVFEADASSVRVASEAPPSMDFSVEASANRLVEAAELELKAAKLKMESNAVVFAAETAARVKNVPNYLREKAVDRVHGAQRQLDLELQAKRREKALLEKQVAAGNERLMQQLPTIGKKPPPPKPLTPLEVVQARIQEAKAAALAAPSSSVKAVMSKKSFEMPSFPSSSKKVVASKKAFEMKAFEMPSFELPKMEMPKMATSTPTKRKAVKPAAKRAAKPAAKVVAKRSAPKKKRVATTPGSTTRTKKAPTKKFGLF
jgi:hypothetical protein